MKEPKEAEEINVNLHLSGKQPQTGTVRVKHWSKSQRVLRGLKALFIVWAIGAVTLVVPLIHFVLPPFCLLLGPVFFSIAHAKKSIIEGGNGTCPNCLKEFSIVNAAHKWPIADVCPNCHRHLTIQPQ